MMQFSSDNWAGAHPKISQHLSDLAGGFDAAYGNGELDFRAQQAFNAAFEREVFVFFVGTGTAANSLALTLYGRPGGIVFAHREAHVIEDECGAPTYLSGGLRLWPVDGAEGRIDPAELEAAIGRFAGNNVHSGRPVAVTLTQSTEAGTVYDLDALDRLVAVARRHGLPVHLDGARFANAMVSLGATAAEMTWKRGVDIVSFGGTKNGCWCAEAVVLFDKAKAEEFAFIRKRAAQLFSKSRFIAAQFEAYFKQGLWLANARHANAMARRLADVLKASATARLAWEPGANEVFAIMKKATMDALLAAGAGFYPWTTPHGYRGTVAADETMCRFVTSFATEAADIDGFARLLAA